ncbi:MAG: tetratricopeptide repeat protein [Gemmatimonadetes bacterium]|nr:tetratricopeptide repeat protein [Gemmatimonadota bacterium]NNM06819.1 tetratricopeptide repeat protein [Gemmatimonadota bacterium]
MKVEELKEQARRHEQREEWQKAFDLYTAALSFQEQEEAPDITLLNRVGDIQTRLGQIDGAVEQYERAIQLYLEAELPNNAIAICKKVLRNLPDRNIFFLRMGQIRASQGFLTDARQNFLAYAERQTAVGDVEGALNALVEFVDLSPEDVEIRRSLASQLESHDRTQEAIDQYSEAYRQLALMERDEEAEEISGKLEELDPELSLPDLDSIRAVSDEPEPEPEPEDLVLEATDLGGIDLVDWDQEDQAPEEIETESSEPQTEPQAEAPEEDSGGVLEVDEIEAVHEVEEADEPDDELPTFDFDAEELAEDAEVITSFGASMPAEEEEDPGATNSADSEGPGDFLAMVGLEDEAATEETGPQDLDELPLIGLDSPEDTLGIGGYDDELPLLGLEEEEEAETREETGLEAPVEDALEGALEDAVFEAGMVEKEEVDESEATILGVPDASPMADHQEAANQGDMDLAIERVRNHIEADPEKVELYQRLVEYAFRKNDQNVLISAYLELAGCLARTGAPSKARAVYQQVLSLSPDHHGAAAGLAELDGVPLATPPSQVSSSEEYVDLGAMILGDDDEESTRWTVPAEAPSGDEEADFAKMLGQFKEKVSEHVAADDVGAHHDLGTAYMEMGLLDEAIGEFQMALRAAPDHLPTYEVMGRCWMEMKKPDMAVRVLSRALAADHEVEDELIGIYYLMARAYEEQGNTGEALEFYEKVFSLDINFEDVTERLRALR